MLLRGVSKMISQWRFEALCPHKLVFIVLCVSCTVESVRVVATGEFKGRHSYQLHHISTWPISFAKRELALIFFSDCKQAKAGRGAQVFQTFASRREDAMFAALVKLSALLRPTTYECQDRDLAAVSDARVPFILCMLHSQLFINYQVYLLYELLPMLFVLIIVTDLARCFPTHARY